MASEKHIISKDTVSLAQTGEFLPDRNEPLGLVRLDANGESTVSSSVRIVNRYIVGTKGNYTTLKACIDFLNVNATAPTEVLLDGGDHFVADTITINNPYIVAIRGNSSGGCIVKSSIGLINKPMFDIQTECYVDKITFDGTAVTGYGNLTTENCFDLRDGVYFDFQNAVIIGFYRQVYIIGVGVELFFYNSIGQM